MCRVVRRESNANYKARKNNGNSLYSPYLGAVLQENTITRLRKHVNAASIFTVLQENRNIKAEMQGKISARSCFFLNLHTSRVTGKYGSTTAKTNWNDTKKFHVFSVLTSRAATK